MFGDMMNEMNAKQKELEAKIKELVLHHTFQDGAIELSMNGDNQLLNLSISAEKVDLSDKEQLEDFVILAMNEAMQIMDGMKLELTNSLMSDMLPPDISGLNDLFS